MLNKIKRIHLIHYCHGDFAWTNSRIWHKKRYIKFFNDTLDKLNEGADFKITIDNIEHGFKVFKKYSPHRLEEFKKRVLEGKICIANGGAALVRPNNCGDELFIRNILHGQNEFINEFGIESLGNVFLNADTAFGHGQLPQILKNSGYELYRIFRPIASLDYKKIPREFIYKGLDGSQINISRGDYTSCLGNTYKYLDFNNIDEVLERFTAEVLAHNLPLQISEDLVIPVGGDDIMPLMNSRDEYERIPEIIELWNSKYNSPKIEFSDLDSYLKEVKKQKLPIIEGVLDPCELFFNLPTRGANSLWYNRFLADRELVSLERLAVMAEALGCTCDFEKIYRLWVKLMEFSGHAMEFTLETDYIKILENARLTNTLISQYKNDVAELICEKAGNGKENEYIIFNLNDRTTQENVYINVTTPMNVKGFKIVDNKGNNLPYQIVNFNLGDKGFMSGDFTEVMVVCNMTLDSMSFTTVNIEFDGSDASRHVTKDLQKTEGDFTVQNGVLSVEFKNNMIHTIVRNSDNKTLYTYTGKNDFGSIRLYSTQLGNSWYISSDEISSDEYIAKSCVYKNCGPLRHTIVTEGKIGEHKVRQTIILNKDVPQIDFKTDIWVTANGFEGYLNAAFPCDCTEIYGGIPFGEEKRDLKGELFFQDVASEGNENLLFEHASKNVYFAKHFTSFTSNDIPSAILQGDCGIYYRTKPKDHTCELFLMRGVQSKKRTLLSEQWVTLIGEDLNGCGHSAFNYSIVFPKSIDDFAELHAMAHQKYRPLFSMARYYTATKNLTSGMQVLGIKDNNLILSALYRRENEYYARFFEPSGNNGAAEIKLNIPFNSAVLCDFRGNEKKALSIHDATVRFDFGKHEIITIKLTKESNHFEN